MKDNCGQECKVVFTGMKLDSLENAAGVLVKGHMEGGIFHASLITAMAKP